MKQDKNDSGKAVELRSEEVQEVMNRIPSAIVRWGMTMMMFMVMGLIIAAANICWYQTIECPFEWITTEGKSEITATLSPAALIHISSHKNIEVTLYSPMFPSKYSENGVSGTVIDFTVDSNRSDGYRVRLNINLPEIVFKKDNGPKIVGSLLITIKDDTLLKNLIDNIAPF